MRHRIFFHLTWTTLDRAPLITLDLAGYLDRALRAIAGQERAQVQALGIVSTHVHLIVRSNPRTDLPRLVQRLKGTTATLGSRETKTRLRWAKGYNIESVGVRALPIATAYVLGQSRHHPEQAIEGWDRSDASGQSPLLGECVR